jgi:DNA-binding transcriptional regulator YiaG
MEVSLYEAEKIRKSLGLTEYEFSTRLGFSYATYYSAKKKAKLSMWMSREIALRYGRVLSALRG